VFALSLFAMDLIGGQGKFSHAAFLWLYGWGVFYVFFALNNNNKKPHQSWVLRQ
jgi:hypothetical protein